MQGRTEARVVWKLDQLPQVDAANLDTNTRVQEERVENVSRTKIPMNFKI